MASGKYLIVNADDFGQGEGITRGILEACQRGIVTSTSMMVRWAAAQAAAKQLSGRPGMSVGLHIDLGEWCLRDGQWESVYVVVPTGDREAIERECRRQLELFRQLMGCNPTHLDTHQQVHRREPIRSVLLEMARELRVPLRSETKAVWYCGYFYGQDAEGRPNPDGVAVDWLLSLLHRLPMGYTELGCHPGYDDGTSPAYGPEREWELATLCDPRVRRAIDSWGIDLRTYADVPVW